MEAFPTPEQVRLRRERGNLTEILKYWSAKLLPMPENYVVFDLETSGFNMTEDLILSIGHVAVEKGQIVSHTDTYLNWPGSGLVDPVALRNKMAYTRQQMESKGTNCPMRYEYLTERGVDPLHALEQYLEMFKDYAERGDSFVAHNGIGFDIPRLKQHWSRFLNRNMDFDLNRVWDTGVMEKACQLGILPDPGDSMYSWSRRVSGTRSKGIYFSLDKHCIPKYGLIEKHALDMAHAHGAGHDCYVTHLLFETYRSILLETPPQSPSPVPASAPLPSPRSKPAPPPKTAPQPPSHPASTEGMPLQYYGDDWG